MITAMDDAPFRIHRTPTTLLFEDEHGRDVTVLLLEDSFWVISLRTRYRFPITREGARSARTRMHDRLGYLARTALMKRNGPSRVPVPPRVDGSFRFLGWRGGHEAFDNHFVKHAALAFPELNPLVTRMQHDELPMTPLFWSTAFRQEKYIVKDAIRFRAARLAMAYAEPRVHATLTYSAEEQSACEAQHFVERFHDWRSLFSPTRKSYRALNQSLERFDDFVDIKWLDTLRRVRLPRAIPSVLHFSFLRELVRGMWTHAQKFQILLGRALEMPEEDLETAIDEVMRTLFEDPTTSRGMCLHTLAELWLREGPPRGACSLAFTRTHLARMQVRYRTRERYAISLNHVCARPPIPLPCEDGIHFLADVSEVIAESREMKHCVATYAGSAVYGRCFLFHIEYEGERATVEVDCHGKVRQSLGPMNQANRAARYGREVLERWGRGFG